MDFNEKLNAISRLIILLTFLGFLITQSFRIIITGIITLGIIIFLYYSKNKESKENFKEILKEGLTNPSSYKVLKNNFKEGNPTNPLSNVTLPEIQFTPNRKSAPPAFNPVVEKDINKSTQEMVQKVSFPNEHNISEKLFKDLGDEFIFDRSMRNFYSTPNTKVVPGDQAAFAQFLYGDMTSCKDGDPLACERNVQRHPPGY